MQLDLLVANLLSPPIMFFLLGIGAVLVRSDLSIPEPVSKLFSLYLLWAIGFKGGHKLQEAGFSVESLAPIVAAVLISALTPFIFFPIARIRLNREDACAVAATYGSVSVVTFITAENFLSQQGIQSSGALIAALALMESPAIVSALVIFGLKKPDKKHEGVSTAEPASGQFGRVLHDAVFGGAVYLLLGSMIAGLLAPEVGYEVLEPFTNDIFHGVLVLFLLDAGMTAAKRLPELRGARSFAAVLALGIPLFSAGLGLGVSRLLGLSVGDTTMMMILAASASYIAVPAALKQALPRANAGLYLPMALAITFPFNIAVGIPLYLWLARAVAGVPAEG